MAEVRVVSHAARRGWFRVCVGLLTTGIALPGMSPTADAADAPPLGISVTSETGDIDWEAAKANGISFAYIEDTVGKENSNPSFGTQYNGAANAGLIRGAWHVAHPDESSGADQANFFVSNGGNWGNGDEITLPGAVDLEAGPKNKCWHLSKSAMVDWIEGFSNAYHEMTARYPVIYTRTDWWKDCTGNTGKFGRNPLWIASYTTGSSPEPLPGRWSHQAIWEYADSGSNPGRQERFNGSLDDLERFANG
ncbi:GH25 family lysozyme [Nocardia terpenica]|uniref:lysozyme n=1 Tax=Nocardia terpenica TaxID=455432 RepID=A0A291RPV9_9NOCA|nr:GH25 family lysozyme [Nocardia terpenica]ATL69308.1 hydrolase [Nocardia terpenica]